MMKGKSNEKDFEFEITSEGEIIITNYTGKSGMKDVEIPDTINDKPVTVIGDGAFYGCENLKKVIIPDSITEINTNAFSKCINLPSVTLPDSVKKIGFFLFGECDSLEEIDVDNKNKILSAKNGVLFSKDKSLLIQFPTGKKQKTYTVPAYVTTIGPGAFEGCRNLTK